MLPYAPGMRPVDDHAVIRVLREVGFGQCQSFSPDLVILLFGVAQERGPNWHFIV